MQFQTDKQVIVFNQDSENQAEIINPPTFNNKRHQPQEQQEKLFSPQAQLAHRSPKSYRNEEKGQFIGEKKAETPVLFQLQIERNQSEHTEESKEYHNVLIANTEVLKTEQMPIEEWNYQQQRSNKYEEDEKEDESSIKKRKKPSRFKDISAEHPKEKSSHKITEKIENKYESKNITKGFFQQQPLQKSYREMKGQKVEKPFQKEQNSEKMDKLNESKVYSKKLPPISQRKDVKQQHHQTMLNSGAESSIMCLNKQHDQIKQLVIKEEKEHQSPELMEEISLSIAMRIVPFGKKIKCIFKRQKDCPSNFYHPSYSLLQQNGRFLLSSKKEWGHINSHYNLSLEQKVYNKDSKSYAGFLKGNFTGTCFNLFNTQNKKAQLVATIYYKPELKCSSNFRKIELYVKDNICHYYELQGSEEDQGVDLKQLYEIGQNATSRKIIKIVNKIPEWNEKRKTFVLNFKGKSKVPSVKNMILTEEMFPERQVLLFCKTEANQFYMQAGSPLSALTAFGVVLTGFDFKLLCE